jgi:hypothetical protein
MQSFSAMRQALASLVLRGPKAVPKKGGGGKSKDTGALKKKKVVKKAVVSKDSTCKPPTLPRFGNFRLLFS